MQCCLLTIKQQIGKFYENLKYGKYSLKHSLEFISFQKYIVLVFFFRATMWKPKTFITIGKNSITLNT